MVVKEWIRRPPQILILYQQWSFLAYVVSKQNELFYSSNESVSIILAPSEACLPIIPVLWDLNGVYTLIERQNLACFIRYLNVRPIFITCEGYVAPVIKEHKLLKTGLNGHFFSVIRQLSLSTL